MTEVHDQATRTQAAEGTVATSASAQRLVSRPSGGRHIGWGVTGVLLGAVAIVASALAPDTIRPYGALDPVPVLWKWPLMWLGAAATNVGAVLYAIGQVQKAMSFLTGTGTRMVVDRMTYVVPDSDPA